MQILISGCNGRMGRAVASLCNRRPDLEVAAGFDLLGPGDRDFPVYPSPAAYCGPGEVVVDFSSPSALDALLEFGLARSIPLVLSTTGYSEEQAAAIAHAAEHIPIFRSANMSFGVNLLLELAQLGAAALGGEYDIEIIERHHSRKVDAPSGTALMLADAAALALPFPVTYRYDRHGVREPRDRAEIGISCVRGGGIVGDHTVLFAGADETIEIRHCALSRDAFAAGALRAAAFLAEVGAPGLYSMADLVPSPGHRPPQSPSL